MGLILTLPSTSSAWWQSGHHVIAVLAFDLLDQSEQAQLLLILESHPRFAADFTIPEQIQDDDDAVHRWHFGTAGYWPDVARNFNEWNRPTWHYELAATMTVGRQEDVNLPDSPGALPETANLESQDLYIAQAIELCSQMLASETAATESKAIAICWLLHLIADGHQPCHAGSLYAESVFPDGDRGANSIPTVEPSNLHAFWDSMLGDRASPQSIARRVLEIQSDEELMRESERIATQRSETLDWLEESRELSIRYVYAPEVLREVQAASRGLVEEIAPIDLSDRYRESAERLAQERAAVAAFRLRDVLRQALHTESND